MNLFPDFPADLSGLTRDELVALIAEYEAAIERIGEGDVPEGITTSELLTALEAGVDQLEALRTQLGEVDAEAAAEDEALAALLARARGEDPEAGETLPDPDAPDPDPDPDAPPDPEAEAEAEATPVEEPEPVTAAATPRRRAAPGRAARNTPRPDPVAETTPLVAAADVPGMTAGQRFDSVRQVAQAIVDRGRQFKGPAPRGRETIPVARFIHPRDETRQLTARDPEGNWDRIQRIVGEQQLRANIAEQEMALTASGPLCAIRTPRYDLLLISDDERPIRNGLPTFDADRGGITFYRPPQMSTITTGVGIIDAAESALEGTYTVEKTCQRIDCPTQTSVDLDTVFRCLEFDNLGARTFPELVENSMGLLMAAHARLAEQKLLDTMSANSTQVTGPAYGGAVSTLIGQIIVAVAGYRSRHRMTDGAPMQVLLPRWVRDMLVVDLMRSAYWKSEQFPTYADVDRFLRTTAQVDPTYYWDTATGDGQIFAAQEAGALLGFPATVHWFLFPAGSWLFLDGGTLDLGVVRDSTLNVTNDYQVFAEDWENLAFVGMESIEVTSTVCASGQFIAPSTGTCPVI